MKQFYRPSVFTTAALTTLLLAACDQSSQTSTSAVSEGRLTDTDRAPLMNAETVEWKYLGGDAAHTRY